jgi:hypothetical protein
MKLALALAKTGIAVFQWYAVEQFAIWRHQYSPEVLAAAHVHQPVLLVPLAWMMTALAAYGWFRWIRSAER